MASAPRVAATVPHHTARSLFLYCFFTSLPVPLARRHVSPRRRRAARTPRSGRPAGRAPQT
eukprot:2513999-Prymnesium_polylepis.1